MEVTLPERVRGDYLKNIRQLAINSDFVAIEKRKKREKGYLAR